MSELCLKPNNREKSTSYGELNCFRNVIMSVGHCNPEPKLKHINRAFPLLHLLLLRDQLLPVITQQFLASFPDPTQLSIAHGRAWE